LLPAGGVQWMQAGARCVRPAAGTASVHLPSTRRRGS
jgi:hypothetical protein